MSFYQPSLSLFDVLNALSEQTRQREPQQRVNQRPPYHGHATYPTARANIFNPFASYEAPAGYFYRDPQDCYYYSPQYDEDAEGEEIYNDEDGDQRMGGTENLENPSYYHTRNGSHQRTDEGQNDLHQRTENDYINDLLTALTGVEPKYSDESNGKEQDKVASTTKTKTTEGKTAEKTESTTTDKTTNTKTEKAPQKPALKKRASSHIHSAAPSLVANPLQISKPETRLDLPFTPEANVYDLKNEYVVVLALPGANSKAFKVDYHPSSHELLVEGNVVDKLGDEKHLNISEIKYGAFERTVKFPVLPKIKDDEIKGKYSNGLLQIRVPKIIDSSDKPVPKKRIAIEDIPDAELEFEKNPNPVEKV